jgi:hypothetical protein
MTTITATIAGVVMTTEREMMGTMLPVAATEAMEVAVAAEDMVGGCK